MDNAITVFNKIEKMELKIKHFDELSTRELYEIVRARAEIFLLEQNIICQDLDRVDYKCLHCFLEEDGELMAYMRAYRTEDGKVKIGRVLSIKHGIGLGTRLMTEALDEVRKRLGCGSVTLHAQKQAQDFYESLGFAVTSDEFLEEGVVHVAMELIY